MTQTAVLDKLIEYAKIKFSVYNAEYELQIKNALNDEERKKITAQQKEFQENHQQLIKILDNGHCFGFSLVHNAMDKLGKLKWWETLLPIIANWKNCEDSTKKNPLEELIFLPDSESLTGETLDNLIERALHYIAFNHAAGAIYYRPHYMHQDTILDPEGYASVVTQNTHWSYFEFLKNGVINRIQHHCRIAGNFTNEKLQMILDETQCKDAFILVNNCKHAIRLAWTGSQWMVYDPNYDHTKPNKRIHFLGTKKECITEIFRILGNSISFDFASDDPNKKFDFPAYKKMKSTEITSLCAGTGLFVLSRKLPEDLLKYLALAEQLPSLRDTILNNCKNTFADDFTTSGNALHCMMTNDSRILPKVLKLAKSSIHYEEIRQNILQALCDSRPDKSTPLIALATYHPMNIISLLEFVVTDHASLECLLDKFMDTNNKNETAWTNLNESYKKQIINFLAEKIIGRKDDFYANIPNAGIYNVPELLFKILQSDKNNLINKKITPRAYNIQKHIEDINNMSYQDIILDVSQHEPIDNHLQNSTIRPYLTTCAYIDKHIPHKRKEIISGFIQKMTGIDINYGLHTDKTKSFQASLLEATSKLDAQENKLITDDIIVELAVNSNNMIENIRFFLENSRYDLISILLKDKPYLKPKILYDLITSYQTLDPTSIKLFVPNNIPLSPLKINGVSLLEAMISYGRYDLIKYSLDNSLLSNYSNYDLGALLIFLVSKDQLELATELAIELLRKYPDTDKTLSYEDIDLKPIEYCINNPKPNAELAVLLCKNNPTLSAENKDGEFPLLIALKKREFDFIEKLIEAENFLAQHSSEQLCKVIELLHKENKHDLVRRMIDILITEGKRELINSVKQTQNSSFKSMVDTKIENDLKQQLFPSYRAPHTFTKNELLNALNNINKTNVTEEKCIVFLKCYLDYLQHKDLPHQLFPDRKTKKIVLNLISYLENGTTKNITPLELGKLINSNTKGVALLDHTLGCFSSVHSLKNLRMEANKPKVSHRFKLNF